MMAFGKQEQPAQQEMQSERYEKRTVTIISGEEKETSNNKIYWRVKDSNGKFYSVWESSVKAELEEAAISGKPILVAVKIEPKGDKTFYSITATGDLVDPNIQEGVTRAAASRAPGGKQSEFGKRMHPDDAVRVTMLASLERANQMVAMTLADKPEGVSYETYVKAKVFEYANWINQMVTMPKTATPPSPTPNPEPQAQPEDSDIPF